MNISSATMPFPARLKTPLQMDPVLLSIGLTLLIGGLLVLASASISVSDNAVGEPFYYLQRQVIAALIGGASAFLCLFIPMSVWRNLGPLLLLIGLALLLVVLIPGVGHEVNGSTRWLRVGAINIQVSEPAAVVYRRLSRQTEQVSAGTVRRLPAADAAP
jgi:cell division protein FtsW